MNLHIFLVLLINTAISLAHTSTSTSMSTFLFTSESVNEGHPGTFVVSSSRSSKLRSGRKEILSAIACSALAFFFVIAFSWPSFFSHNRYCYFVPSIPAD